MRRLNQDQQAVESSRSRRPSRQLTENAEDDPPPPATTATTSATTGTVEHQEGEEDPPGQPSGQPPEQHQGRITFYSTNLAQQQPFADPSTLYVGPTEAPAAATAPNDLQVFYQYGPHESAQSAFTRLPPFSSLVSSPTPEPRTQPQIVQPRAFTAYPAYEFPRPQSAQPRQETQSPPITLQLPGMARRALMPFIFHHPEYGIESCVLKRFQQQQDRDDPHT